MILELAAGSRGGRTDQHQQEPADATTQRPNAMLIACASWRGEAFAAPWRPRRSAPRNSSPRDRLHLNRQAPMRRMILPRGQPRNVVDM